MISITENDYEAILDVRREGLMSGLRLAILEKDVLIAQVLGLLQHFNWDEFAIVFCGGTSLSKGYRLIDRMSEDVDRLTAAQSRRLGIQVSILAWDAVAQKTYAVNKCQYRGAWKPPTKSESHSHRLPAPWRCKSS